MTPHPAGSGQQDSVADGFPPAEERQRALRAVLAEVGEESLALDDIAAAVAGHLDQSGQVDPPDRLDQPAGTDSRHGENRQLRIALHHIHLPKLGALSGFEYDPESNRLEAADDIGEALREAHEPAPGAE